MLSGFASVAFAFDPLNGDYSRDNAEDVRIVSYNHAGNFIEDPGTDAAFDRILTALDPDVICFQEFSSAVSQGDVANRLNSILPIDGGGSWQIHFGLLGGIRTVLASRYPLSLTRVDTIPASSTRGVTIALADLPDAVYAVDVYLLGVHLKCCGDPGGSEDEKRQGSADAIANWLGDARGVSRPSGNHIVLPVDTPMIALGDFNLVGGPQPEDTIVSGDIQDEGTYGPDVKGDWDVSDLTNLMPADPFTGDTFTWQGSSSFPPSALDRMFYTDAAITVANSFVLNTDTMTPQALAAAGLQAGDTLPQNTSDHLPIAMDLRLTGDECLGDGDCDDGAYCNGSETCVSGVCQTGSAVDCNDAIACTVDNCNESTDRCDNVPNDAACDDGLFCNGAETCDVQFACLPGDDPCPGQFCDEAADACVDCLDDDDCDDGAYCNGAETCVSGTCQAGVPVDCADEVGCTTDACNESTDACDNLPDDGVCDNGLFCDGAESCDPLLGCRPGTPVICDDGVACTVDACNDSTDTCDHTPDDGACDNGLFCDGVETCHATLGCRSGAAPCDGSPCDEAGDVCVECIDAADCDDDDVCTWDRCVDGVCEFAPADYGDVDHNGAINLFDVFCILDGIGGDFSVCSFQDDDIEPCAGNGVLNLLDVLAVLGAIAGDDPCCGA